MSSLFLYHLFPVSWDTALSLLYSGVGMSLTGDTQGCSMSSSIWLPSSLKAISVLCCWAALAFRGTHTWVLEVPNIGLEELSLKEVDRSHSCECCV